MRLIRTLLLFLAIVLAFVGLLIAAAFLPPVQTWVFQTRVLDRMAADYPGLHASVESVSAGLSSIELTNLKLERNGIVFTAPDVQARLPLKAAVLDKQILVSHLVGKGWTLALGPEPGPVTYDANGDIVRTVAGNTTATEPTADASAASGATTPTTAGASTDTADRLRRILTGWQLPFDGSVDGAELEGDVLVPPRSGNEPLAIHVAAQGGGLAAGRTATLTLSGSGPTGILALPEARVAGNATLSLTATRQLDGVGFNGTVSPAGQSHGVDLALKLAGLADATALTGQLDVNRNGRHLASIATTLSHDGTRLAGSWKINLGHAEIARLHPSGPVPVTALAGEGRFDSDVDLKAVHVAGSLNGSATQVAERVPVLSRLGAVAVKANFDALHTGGAVRITTLRVIVTRPVGPSAADMSRGAPASDGNGAPSAERARTLAIVTSKQPFTLADATHHPTPTNPNADWLDVSLRDCPLTLLPALPGGFSFGRGDATGDFTIMAVNGGYGVRANGPIEAHGVSIQRRGRVTATGLDLSLALLADTTPEHGWVLRAAPLRVSGGGHELATITATLPLRRDEYGRIPLTGKWTADFDALRGVLRGGFADAFNARSGSGEFTANIGAAADLTAKVNLVGHDSTHTVSATISGSLDDYRSATFEVPIRVAFGTDASQFTVSGTCVADADRPRIDLQVGSPQLALEHLQWIATVLPAVRDAFGGGQHSVATGAARTEQRLPNQPAPASARTTSQPASAASAAPAPARPFWGSATGRIRFDVQRIIAGTHEWDELGGTVELQPTSLALHGGRIVYNPVSAAKFDALHQAERTVEPHSAITGEGSLTFDPAAVVPYELKASGTVDGVNVAHFLAPVAEGEQPTLEGRFAVADTITSAGRTLSDVMVNRQEQFRLTSETGIIRILKANVAAALPNPDSRVGDAAAGVGSAVSALFGHKLSGNVKVDPRTDAVLNFSYGVAEIGFDHFTATAARQPDGSFRLSDIDIRSAREHLTGAGEIASAAGRPVAARPLTLELKLGVKGIGADRLRQVGLLAPDKDALGYADVREPLHLGGTLDHIDNTAWRDLLARAILAKR